MATKVVVVVDVTDFGAELTSRYAEASACPKKLPAMHV